MGGVCIIIFTFSDMVIRERDKHIEGSIKKIKKLNNESR